MMVKKVISSGLIVISILLSACSASNKTSGSQPDSAIDASVVTDGGPLNDDGSMLYNDGIVSNYDGSSDSIANCNPEGTDDADIADEGDAGTGYCPEYPIIWPAQPRDGGDYFCYFVQCQDSDGGVAADGGTPPPPPSYITPAHVAAIAELALLDPGANPKKLFWTDSTDTLESVQLNVPLPGCTSGKSVEEVILPLLDAHPALFQLDTAEWEPEHINCDDVPTTDDQADGGRHVLSPTMHRKFAANHPIQSDAFSYVVTRIQNVVTLVVASSIVYLPKVSEVEKQNIDDSMTGCGSISLSQIKVILREMTLQVQVIDILTGTVQGTASYQPKGNDIYILDPQINQIGDPPIFTPMDLWLWKSDFSSDVPRSLLTRLRSIRVLVNPCNYFPDLVHSDANCNFYDSVGATLPIGFDIDFDAHSGDILSIKNGFGGCNYISYSPAN